MADGLDSVPTNRSFGEGRSGVDSANSSEGLIEWNSMAPSSSRERLQSGANAAFSPGEPLDRVDSSGSLATGQPGRRRPATKFNLRWFRQAGAVTLAILLASVPAYSGPFSIFVIHVSHNTMVVTSFKRQNKTEAMFDVPYVFIPETPICDRVMDRNRDGPYSFHLIDGRDGVCEMVFLITDCEVCRSVGLNMSKSIYFNGEIG